MMKHSPTPKICQAKKSGKSSLLVRGMKVGWIVYFYEMLNILIICYDKQN